MLTSDKGFTLIEMMVTLCILSVLAAASVPLVRKGEQRKNEAELRASLREIRDAIDRYHQASLEGIIEKEADGAGYPQSLSVLVTGKVNKRSPDGEKIYFLRRIPRDPMCECRGRDNADTWRVRSSTSPPGRFDGGKDVFDIASANEREGLNGIPYAQW